MYGQEFEFFDLLDIFKNRQEVEGGTGECVAVYDYTDFISCVFRQHSKYHRAVR